VTRQSLRRNARSAAALAVIFACATAPIVAAAADSPAPRLVAAPQVDASVELTWDVVFTIFNPLGVGIYPDSLTLVVEDLDPGETRAPRTSSLDLAPLLRAVESVGAGDSATFQSSVPATAEHARLTFKLGVRQGDRVTYASTATVEAMPGPFSLEHPSQFLEVGGKKVEYVLVPAARDSGLAPGLMMIHGHANHARKMLRSARMYSARGYTVLLASMPGYGQSDGPPDFMGPATVKAMAAAFDRLKAAPGVDPKRLGLWGVSRGATVVTLLAQQRNDVACVISQSGIYDMWAGYRGTGIPGIRENMVNEMGRDSSAWRARSPALATGKPGAAFLILHGENDANVPFAQARGFAQALAARGVTVETRFFPDAEHMLPRGEVQRTAVEFLKRQLAP
jgi:dipeptidyl aminopeptidase/acylaminoacyl peptidase